MTTLYSKEGFTFIKTERNQYSLQFRIQNNNIILAKVIDFNLVKLIYDLNTDIYEQVYLNQINSNEAVISMLMKPLFEDLGFPQKFSYLTMTKYHDDINNRIIIRSQSIKDRRPEGYPPDAELAPISSMNCTCNIISDHNIDITCDIQFDRLDLPPVVEKLVGIIIFKIFNRVKLFIEKVVI